MNRSMERTIIDENGDVQCPKCGARDAFTSKRTAKGKMAAGLAAPKRLQCQGCGTYLKPGSPGKTTARRRTTAASSSPDAAASRVAVRRLGEHARKSTATGAGRRTWSRAKRLLVSLVGLFVVLIIIGGIVGSSPSKKRTARTKQTAPTKSAPTKSAPTSLTSDHRAEADVNEALRVIAQQHEDFHSYGLVTARILGNLDHRLRSVKTLKASSTKTTFTVAVTSNDGTIFRVNGSGTRIDRVCSPSGGLCSGGHWRGGHTLVMPAIPKLTAAEKSRVRSILLASVNHYATLLHEGQQILGSTQYPSAQAGLRAFNDPRSAASRFSAYRKRPGPERDLSFLQAFSRADHYFTAANEPAAIGNWRDVMSNAQSALYAWVQNAVSWQIKQVSTTKLDADASRVTRDLARARALALKASA